MFDPNLQNEESDYAAIMAMAQEQEEEEEREALLAELEELDWMLLENEIE